MNKVLIIDGPSLFFRSFYVSIHMEPRLDHNDNDINAVFIFIRMLLSFLKKNNYHQILVAFDKSAHTFRKKIFVLYKTNRQKTPPLLLAQLPVLKEFLNTSSIPYFEIDNYEADDIIGTLAKQAEIANWEINILSSDRDMFQLVSDHTYVLHVKKGLSNVLTVDKKKLYDLMQLTPAQIIDFKALAGDSSDNIKGVPGFGKVTTTKLLQKYVSLENLYNHLDDLPKKQKELLLAHQDEAFLSKKIATIYCQVPLNFSGFYMTTFNWRGVNTFAIKYKMYSLLLKKNNAINAFLQNKTITSSSCNINTGADKTDQAKDDSSINLFNYHKK